MSAIGAIACHLHAPKMGSLNILTSFILYLPGTRNLGILCPRRKMAVILGSHTRWALSETTTKSTSGFLNAYYGALKS